MTTIAASSSSRSARTLRAATGLAKGRVGSTPRRLRDSAAHSSRSVNSEFGAIDQEVNPDARGIAEPNGPAPAHVGKEGVDAARLTHDRYPGC